MEQLKKLSVFKVIKVYRKYLVNDFPRNERRPLSIIIKLMMQHQYICYGYYKNQELIGYTLLYKHENLYLVDYLAVIEKYRSQSFGTQILKELLNKYQNEPLLFEVEDPSIESNLEKEKRMHFYLKQDLKILDTKVYLFYVHYVLLSNTKISKEQLESLYKALYPNTFYEKYVEFL